MAPPIEGGGGWFSDMDHFAALVPDAWLPVSRV